MRRRELLSILAAAPLAGGAASRSTIALLETFAVRVNHRGNWLLVRITTSDGVSGIGDASHGRRDEVTARYIRQFFEAVKGRTVYDVEFLRRSALPAIHQNGMPAAVAMSGIEQCLWDIQGKLSGAPTYQLFGGRLHDTIRNYANINRATTERTPEGFAEYAGAAVKAGFDAVKLASFDGMPKDPVKAEEHTRQGIACIAAVRKAIGDRALLIDAHSNFSLERGLQLARELERYDLYWLEEVTPAKPLDQLARINGEAKMQTAGGESIYGVEGFVPYLNARAVDIAMPDVKYCGGMLELKKIAAFAEALNIPVSPHGPASPIGNYAAAHVCVTLPNFLILEYAFGEIPWRAELIDPPEQIKNGRLTLSAERPGLGITLNEKTLARYKVA